jgi:transcriptional regulator with XRE-family HTH domain
MWETIAKMAARSHVARPCPGDMTFLDQRRNGAYPDSRDRLDRKRDMANRGLEPLRVPEDFWHRDEVTAVLRDRDIGMLFKLIRQHTGASQTQLGIATGLEQGYVSRIMVGRKVMAIDLLERIADGCAMPDHARMVLGLAAQESLAAVVAVVTAGVSPPAVDHDSADQELESLELARRVAATDVGEETLIRLEQAVDDLATRYPVTPPGDLLHAVRRHLLFVAQLIDARKTLSEHRRLLAAGGWLSLLAATLDIDLKHHRASRVHLRTAQILALQAGHREMHAWCFETKAWSVLTEGDYAHALALSQAAQRIAPRGSSAQVQASAQEGRAWARLGQRKETYEALDRVARLVSPMSRPERPEHHYRYDPDKSVAYTATTLAWLGDPAAEPYAREVIDRLRSTEIAGRWPRRVASAQLDLALALIAADKLDEACAHAQSAFESGRVVPSNHWRALEVVTAAEARGPTEGRDLRETYEAMRRSAIMPE